MNGYSTSQSKPRVEIIEQPAPKALRFRYECEGRSAGSIPGVNSTSENRSYPTIRIVGYEGNEDIVIVVSCVTKNQPFLAHPHNLVGKDCKEGVCSIALDKETKTATFSNLGIQCVKKRDIENALKIRQEKKVDPFGNGFEHMNNPSSIDLNCVRLCFQAIIKGPVLRLLGRAVSDPVYDKKAMSDLLITRLSHASAPVRGGLEMILLCEKITKEDIKVRIYEEVQGQEVWDAFAETLLVHKQVAIAFKTPAYRNLEVHDKVPVFIQLYRPSDKATSESVQFFFTPESGYSTVKRSLGTHIPPPKRTRIDDDVISNQVLPGIFDIRPSTPLYPVKSEPNSSPASPFQNTYSPSVTPVPSDQNPYVPIPGPSTGGLPTFRDTNWHGNFANMSTLGGGRVTVPNLQPFPVDTPNILTAIFQYDAAAMLSEYTNASPAIPEPLNAYTCPNALNPINNDEINNANVDMASVERIVESSDLIGMLPPANDAQEPAQNDVQQLSENFNLSMNISGEYRDSLTRMVNETFDNKYNH